MDYTNRIEGLSGEVEAEMYLKKKGYKILAVNYKNIVGEIDLIAKDGEYIVFVEVKKRSTKEFGLPREAVTPQKQQKIRKVAMGYLKEKRLFEKPCRFDVVDILGEEITHIEDAF